MIKVYGLKNCDRCRAALKWLKERGVKAQFHDVRQDGFPEKRATNWIAKLGAEPLVNRRSATWRQLQPAQRAADVTPESAIALMSAYPALLKRPVMEIGDMVFIGFDDAARTDITRALEKSR